MEKIMYNEQYISTAVSRIQQPKKSMKEKVCFMLCTELVTSVILRTLGRKVIVLSVARYIWIYANHDAVIVIIILLKSVY